MQRHCSGRGIVHPVNRDNIYACTLAMYKNMETEILNEYPFRVKFDREQAIDSGGVSRDFCSAFWEVAYEKAFDGNILLSPALYSNVNLESLKTIGAIISHMYLAIGFIPVRISLPSLACIFLGPNSE